MLPPTLPQTLPAFLGALPHDAALFFVGSYSRSTNPRLTLAELPVVPHTSPPIHRRLNGSAFGRPPHILGTVAYAVTARGAAALASQPVRAEADVDLSLLAPTSKCAADHQRCAVAAPSVQYGPSRWLVWQDETVGRELTHGTSKGSVRDGWLKACRGAKPTDQGLLKACRRFGFGGG